MKYHNLKNNLLVVGLTILLLGSCTNLDETLYSEITAEKTTLSAEDLISIIAPAYTSLRDVYWGWDGLADLYEESSDCVVVPGRYGDWGAYYITMHQHTWNPSLSHIWRNWNGCYAGITNVNRAIYQLDMITGIPDKEKYTNELRALRAYYYYLLFDNFRNIPVVTKFDLPKGFLPTQSTPKETYDFIVKELTETMPSLSAENNRATYGRFTKWAAKMTLAKLYLNYEVYFGTPKWAEAQAQVEEVISSGKFTLAVNYKDPFLSDNENSVEEIFSIPLDNTYTTDVGCYHPFKALYPASYRTFNLSGQPWNGSGAIPQFIDTYDPDDSRLKDTWLGGLQVTSSGAPLILDSGPGKGKQLEYVNYMSEVTSCLYNEGYRLAKYEIKSGEVAQTSNDVPLYRYTDALMIKAECLLRQGKADEAATIVTQIRQRAFKNAPAKATVTGAKLTGGSIYKYGAYSYGKVTDLEGGADIKFGGFLDELGWEFVGEHHRKQDLIRFDVYTKKSWFCKTKKDDKMKIFPIPKEFMDANSNLKQNSGY